MQRTSLAIAVAFALTACFSPTIQPGVPCGAGGECPDGQQCAYDNRCYPADDIPLPEVDAALPDAELPDADLRPACDNEADDDDDGLADYPDDPGCTSSADEDEADGCPDDPGCPECGNGADDDNDGDTDYPDDLQCSAASDDVEVDECLPGIAVTPLTSAGAEGTTPEGSTSNFQGSCNPATTATEVVYGFYLEAGLAALTFSTEGSLDNTVLYVRFADCGNSAAEVDCLNVADGGEKVTITNAQPGWYYIFVDGDFESGIDYELEVGGVIGVGGECVPGDSDMVCLAHTYCDADQSPAVCRQYACSNGADDDSDSATDYPADPGCTGVDDNSEGDDDCSDCPGNGGAGCDNCPTCSDGVDNDGDSATDYPADNGCLSAADPSEVAACSGGVEPIWLTDVGAAGVTAAAGSGDFTASCAATTSTAPEDVYAYFNARALASLTFSTLGATGDTVTYVWSDDCDDGTEIGCVDWRNSGDEVTIAAPTTAAMYYVFVDGDTQMVDYVINVRGTIALDGACLVGDSQFRCVDGALCRSGTCLAAACNDSVDNDDAEDSLADYPADPGCSDISDDSENDDCPDCEAFGGGGCVACPQCSDGADNDGDLFIDRVADPGCAAAGDDRELDQCVAGLEVELLGDGGASGTTPSHAQGSLTDGDCNYGTTVGTEVAYRYENSRALASLTFTTTADESVTYVREGSCAAANEVACGVEGDGISAATVWGPIVPATFYYVIVDSLYESLLAFDLDVTGTVAAGSACTPGDPQFPCESGFVCPSGTCVAAACNNGLDDADAEDSLADYPDDPGCSSPSDDDESDDCPDCTGNGGLGCTSCPDCGDGDDNDLDELSDYPDDPGCAAAGDDSEEDCSSESDPLQIVDGPTFTGSTTGLTNDFEPTQCATSYTTGPEEVYSLYVPGQLLSLAVDTEGTTLDTVLYVRRGVCESVDVACADGLPDDHITMVNVAPGNYFIFVDGYNGRDGDYQLNIHGVIAAGEVCDPDQVSSGLFACESGYYCDGATCEPTDCNDSSDNDGDDLSDFPEDPGCSDPNDTSEDDDCELCPACSSCPQCSDGVDNDSDSFTDFGFDLGCMFAGDDDEVDECIAGHGFAILDDLGAAGTTPAAAIAAELFGACAPSSADHGEDIYAYVNSRDLFELTFTTAATTNSVTYVREAVCSDAGSEVACANESGGGESVTLYTPANGGVYFVFVDATVDSVGYTLDVSGLIAGGAACDPVDTQFVCERGYRCVGMVCVETQCNNSVDDDDPGDGLIDLGDPGCTDIDDDDESDTCASDPPTCPACWDGVDNDSDTQIDFPADLGCEAAGDDDESDCADSAVIAIYDTSPETGTTVGGGDDHTPECRNSSTAADVVYRLFVSGWLSTLTVDTNGSGFDTVLHIYQSSCLEASVGCDDDGGDSTRSLITLSDVAPGQYFLVVDGYSSFEGAYMLNVSGTIVGGEPCDPAQVSAGFMTCAAGTSCTDSGSGYTCTTD